MKNIIAKSFSVDEVKGTDSPLIIRAIVSTIIQDRDGQVVDTREAKLSTGASVFLDHSYSVRNIVGTVESIEWKDGNLEALMRFSKENDEAVKTFNMIKEGIIKNPFSIGFMYDTESSTAQYLKVTEVMEISIVGIAANQDSKVIAYKNADLGTEEVTKDDIKALDIKESIEEVEGKVVEKVKELKIEKEDTMTEEQIKAMTQEAVSVALKARDDEVAAEAHKAAQLAEKKKALEVSAKNYQKRTIMAIKAKIDRNEAEYTRLRDEALEVKGLHGQTQLGDAILCEELNREIVECINETEGEISKYVSKFTLVTSNVYAYLVKTGQIDFQWIEDCAPKKDGGSIGIKKSNRQVREIALIGAICDTTADDIIVNAYNMLVKEIAQALMRAYSKVVLTFDGDLGAGPVPADASGLLVNPTIVANTTTFTAATAKSVLRAARLKLAKCARKNFVWVMSEDTYVSCVLPMIDECCAAQPQVSAGSFGVEFDKLWGHQIILDDLMPAKTLLAVDLSYYHLVTKGILATEFSNIAYSKVLDISGFDQDATLYRAHTRIAGVMTKPEAGAIFTCA